MTLHWSAMMKIFLQTTKRPTPAQLPRNASHPVEAKKKKGGGDGGKRKKVALESALQGLEKDQIIKLLVGKHKNDAEEITKALPKPDIEAVEKHMTKLSRKIDRSFPHVRFGTNLDRFAWRRVNPAITAFKTAALDYGRRFVGAKEWNVVIDFVTLLLPMVDGMPEWEDVSKRKPQEFLFKSMDSWLKKAIKGASLSREEINSLKELINTESHVTSLRGAVAAIKAVLA